MSLIDLYTKRKSWKELGFIINDMTLSQDTMHILLKCAQHMEKDKTFSPVLFYENFNIKMLQPCFPCTTIGDINYFKGPIITTNLTNTLKALDSFNKKIFFYPQDLEWYTKQIPYEQAASIYRAVPIIARSKSHRMALENAWNIKVVDVCDDFDIETLLKIAHND